MFANQRVEQISHDELKTIQTERLERIVKWAYERTTFYHEKLVVANVQPADVVSLESIRNLPFTTTEEIKSTSIFDFLTMPLSGIANLSYWGRENDYFLKAYTSGDIARNIEVLTRVFSGVGLNRASVVGLVGKLPGQLEAQIGCALNALGITVVNLGSDYSQVLNMMSVTGLETLVGEARDILQIIVEAQAIGKDILEYPLTKIVCLNDKIHNHLKDHIERRTATQVYNLFVSNPLGAAGILYQCGVRVGQHVAEDLFYPEVVVFGSDELITDDSRIGELVITTLAAEAMPLLRYRTGQMVRLIDEGCSCGRRLSRVDNPLANFN